VVQVKEHLTAEYAEKGPEAAEKAAKLSWSNLIQSVPRIAEERNGR